MVLITTQLSEEAMAVAAADIAPKAFQQLVSEGGKHQDVEDDLQVKCVYDGERALSLFSPPRI